MDPEASEGRARKLRKSCERCRSSKSRCCPSIVDDEGCNRCIKEGKQCIFLEAKPREKRAKSSRLRVAEMEEKLENIFAMLSQNSSGSGSEAAKEDYTNALMEMSDSSPEGQVNPSTCPPYFDTVSTYNRIPSLPENAKSHEIPVSIPYPVFDNIQDAISKGMISFVDAEECLTSFQKVTSSFPFVVIPPQTSLDFLRRERPFLLLAILCFGSHPKARSTLEDEFRETLSKKIIMNGEKSLDLLQGVLVYLNWYHYYFKLGRQQIYQLSQIAASMAVDLYIHHNWQSPSKIDSLAIPIPSFDTPEISDDIEGKRTFLGTYYLSSAICLCLRKPSTLKYNEHVHECSQILGRIGTAETDYLIPYFIRIQQFVEEVTCAFQCNVPQKLPPSDSARIDAMCNGFQHRVSQMEMSFPREVRNHPTIAVSLYSLQIYITEVGFHAAPPSPLDLMSEYYAQSWYYSTARSETIIKCLQATKNYLDFFLALPNEAILNFCLPDLFRLVYAVLVLGTFTTGCGSPTLDDAHMREASGMLYYLDGLNTKTSSMITHTGSEENRDYMWHMRCIFQKTKTWYSCIAAQSRSSGYLGLDSRYLSFMNILPGILGKCTDESTILSRHTEGNTETEYSASQPWPDGMSEFRLIVDHPVILN